MFYWCKKKWKLLKKAKLEVKIKLSNESKVKTNENSQIYREARYIKTNQDSKKQKTGKNLRFNVQLRRKIKALMIENECSEQETKKLQSCFSKWWIGNTLRIKWTRAPKRKKQY